MKTVKIDGLVEQLVKSSKRNYDFGDIIDLDSALNRCMYIAEIDGDVGDTVSSYIRFYNRWDEQNGTPVDQREPIKIYIDSPGGDIMATFAIIDSIAQSKTPIHTINVGGAFSGGFFVFISGHKRISYPNATFLFHEGATGIMADANKFKNWSDFYRRMLERMKNHTLKHTNISEEEYDKHINDDWWMFAEEALELGICDEIL